MTHDPLLDPQPGDRVREHSRLIVQSCAIPQAFMCRIEPSNLTTAQEMEGVWRRLHPYWCSRNKAVEVKNERSAA